MIFKIICAGEGAVGKTSFLNKYINDTFDEMSTLTKGVEFFEKRFEISGHDCALALYDFGGQDRFRFMLADFVKGSCGAFLLFDLTRLTTLDNMDEWFGILEQNGKIPVLLLGSKDDIEKNGIEELMDKTAAQIMEMYDNCFDYLKISSKTGENVEKAFNLLINKIISMNEEKN